MRTWYRLAITVILTVGMLGAVGCRRRGHSPSTRMARYERNLLRHASRDTGCSASQLAPAQITSTPAVYTVTGCAQPIEYWLRCNERGNRCSWNNVARLNEAAAAPLSCPPQMIQQQPTQSPNSRYAVGCGRMVGFTIACNPAACGWAQTGPVQQGNVAMGNNPPPGYGAVVVQGNQQQGAQPAQPQATTAPNLTTQVQAQREAILSCVDEGSLRLRVRWTPEGQVIIQLPQHLVGTEAEGCIQAVLSALRVQTGQAGEVEVPVE